MKYTPQLFEQMGLLRLVPKTGQVKQPVKVKKDKLQIDKNEFRLLVNILQAIKHDCQYELIEQQDHHIIYNHPKKKLIFSEINQPDSSEVMHLSSLKDLLDKPQLKRPVWEKLKTL